MRIALVSGDGLPTSGLLTVFRNVLQVGRDLELVELPVATDLGYAWRPDKAEYYPVGGARDARSGWMRAAPRRVRDGLSDAARAAELIALRDGVAAYDSLGADARRELAARIETLTEPYRVYFAEWLAEHEPDWVFGLNMTLSDAVPATAGLHAAVREHFAGGRRRGGVVFWDHDLFGSCAIHDPQTGARVYPERPNALTPLPRDDAHTRWIVISDGLADEASSYPTDAVPEVVSNLLPTVPEGRPEARHREFAAQQGLQEGRPVLLDPVRVFRIKGVDVAVRLLAEMREEALRTGEPVPYLLVFGGLDEDPEYAREVTALCAASGVEDDVRFLDGVPLTSVREDDGTWRLDEVDLLRVAAASSGGVVFTPGVTDVETVGLGPGLAAMAGLPCLTTEYDVFEPVYGPEFARVRMDTSPESVRAGAAEFVRTLAAFREGDDALRARLEVNRKITEDRFPRAPWERFWRELRAACA
ncbi:hypothetical protein [Streptomyces nanshensis]|uniref:hypothetical protein n=1 Tax=Streptomyces nanshensis TaxID=518642 RepID=UPI00099FC13D|nr:hypothetical protein [Streptomyces nanshensis]